MISYGYTTYMDNDNIKSGLWLILLISAFVAFLVATGLVECSDATDRAYGTGTEAKLVK